MVQTFTVMTDKLDRHVKFKTVSINIKSKRGSPHNVLASAKFILNSVNLQFNTVGRRDDDMIVPPSDGPMFILID